LSALNFAIGEIGLPSMLVEDQSQSAGIKHDRQSCNRKKTLMKKSGTGSWVQGVLVVLALALIAIPLSRLMVASSSTVSDVPSSIRVQPPSVSIEATDAAEVSSPVSSLMAGSAVGPTRGAILAPRNPASAFVPF